MIAASLHTNEGDLVNEDTPLVEPAPEESVVSALAQSSYPAEFVATYASEDDSDE